MDLAQWISVATQTARHLPVFIVLVVAVVIAVRRWEQHPTTSGLVVTAAGLMVAEAIANSVLSVWMTASISSRGWSGMRVSEAYALWGVLLAVFHAGVIGLLVAAIFSDRARVPPAP